MRWAERQPSKRRLISLTPLIDVVFILIVFFMLASNFFDWRQIALDTPAVVQGAGSRDSRPLVVTIRAEGDVQLDGEVLKLAGLDQRLRSALKAEPARAVILRPAPGATLQQAVAVLDRVTALGVRKLQLAGE